MKGTTTSWSVAGIGAAVTALGATLFRGTSLGSGVIGFGLAHVILGLLDRMRPSVNK